MGFISFMFCNGHGFNFNNANNRIRFGFWLFFGSCFRYSKEFYIGGIMNITQLEKKIIKAVNQEINVAGKVGINDNDYYDPNIELEKLKQFIKNCFKEHKKGQ